MDKKEITHEMTAVSYRVGELVYNKVISRKEGIERLVGIGMSRGSASGYINVYKKLVTGEVTTWTINAYTTSYYLQKMFEAGDKVKLTLSLDSLYKHIVYYEGKSGNRVKQLKDIHAKYTLLIKSISNDNISFENIFPDEVEKPKIYIEGAVKQILVNGYERNKKARDKCIEVYKDQLKCIVCSFNFEEVYGEIGKGFIHVHHKIELSTIGKQYKINPLKDLIPVCPNCHAMLHKKKPHAYTVEELKSIIDKIKSSDKGS